MCAGASVPPFPSLSPSLSVGRLKRKRMSKKRVSSVWMSPASEHMKVEARRVGGGSVVMGRTMRMDLRFFGACGCHSGALLSFCQADSVMLMCSLCVSGSCCLQAPLPYLPLLRTSPATAVSELQLTHLSRIRLVGCACESFGGCRVPAREREGDGDVRVWSCGL